MKVSGMWWIGRVTACDTCDVRIEIEEGDKVTYVAHRPAYGFNDHVSDRVRITCPVCGHVIECVRGDLVKGMRK